jgi:PAP2 superfamily
LRKIESLKGLQLEEYKNLIKEMSKMVEANEPDCGEMSNYYDLCVSIYNEICIAFPEGSPTHPSYPAGHATVAGACVTILKARFNEDYPIKNPVITNDDGTALRNYNGPGKDQLTLGGELNKLAANIAIGRNMAGVHYRSDYIESVKLGEMVAIGILQDQRNTYFENYSLTLKRNTDLQIHKMMW